jgi:2-haloacid dehalogenase
MVASTKTLKHPRVPAHSLPEFCILQITPLSNALLRHYRRGKNQLRAPCLPSRDALRHNLAIMQSDSHLNRRSILCFTAATAAIATLARAATATPNAVKAIAFDALVIFDPRPVFALGEELFPGQGATLGELWRTRQFEYCWLRTLTGRYADFRQVTDDALVFAAAQLKLDLTAEKRERLLQATLALKAYPDVQDALSALRRRGIRLALLSNFSARMLEANIAAAGLDGAFEALLSTDRVRAYKPDPRAYRMAIDALGLGKEEIVFAAFAGWDAAGAKSFGYRTFWANRRGFAAEELGVRPDAIGATVTDLAAFALS